MKFTKGAKAEPDKSIFSKATPFKKSFSGFTPNLFVGSFGYPFVNIGALSSEEKTSLDTPKEFVSSNADVNEVIRQRQSFVNSKMLMKVQNLQGRFVEQVQDIAKSSVKLDSEVDLLKPLQSRIDNKSMPHGPSAMLKKLELTSNAKVKRKIESLTSDTDVSANQAIKELGRVADEHHLTKLLSAGTLGQKRKIVPTKWSITAVDDIKAKQLLEQLQGSTDIHAHYFQAELMGNNFHVFFFPGAWSFELMEITMPQTIYNKSNTILLSHDYEYAQGRKMYVKETAGAYYAARLAILEYLHKKNRIGRVVVIRTIKKEYTAPLGVWIIREGIRVALNTKQEQANKKTIIHSINNQKIPAATICSQLIFFKEQQKRLADY